MSVGFFNAKKQPMRAHKNILVFSKKQAAYYPQKTFGHVAYGPGPKESKLIRKTGAYRSAKVCTRTDASDGSRYPRSVQYFPKGNNERSLHPTQKPVALLEYLIKTYSQPGELVLDNCMGSGSTVIAALNTGRRAIGMELNQTFFETAKRRVEGWIPCGS